MVTIAYLDDNNNLVEAVTVCGNVLDKTALVAAYGKGLEYYSAIVE